MILYSTLTRLENRKIELTFIVENNIPTTVNIQWLDTSFSTETYTLTKNGDKYTASFYSRSDKILATVEGETCKIFETNDNEFITNDLPLEIRSGDIWLPFCQLDVVQISILNESGKELEKVTNSGYPCIYYPYNRTVNSTSTVYDDIKLFSILSPDTSAKVKINDQWVSLYNIGRYYIRVSNVIEPEGLSQILYQGDYINTKYYNQTYGVWMS